MQKNLDRMGGLVHSQRVLLALTQAGLSREDAYALVQRNAMKVWESDGQLSLLDLLKADPDVSQRLSTNSSMRCSTSIIISSMSTRSSTGCSAPTNLSASYRAAGAAGDCLLDAGDGNRWTGTSVRANCCRSRSSAASAASSRRLSARAVARLDRAPRVGEHPSFARPIARHLIDEPLGRFVHAQPLHDLRNLFSRLSGTTGIARAYGVRLTDEPRYSTSPSSSATAASSSKAVPLGRKFGEGFGAVGGLIAGLPEAAGRRCSTARRGGCAR